MAKNAWFKPFAHVGNFPRNLGNCVILVFSRIWITHNCVILVFFHVIDEFSSALVLHTHVIYTDEEYSDREAIEK